MNEYTAAFLVASTLITSWYLAFLVLVPYEG